MAGVNVIIEESPVTVIEADDEWIFEVDKAPISLSVDDEWIFEVDKAPISLSVEDPLPFVIGLGGPPGPAGPQGPQGLGLPPGGDPGFVLVKNSGTNYDTGWAAPGAVPYATPTVFGVTKLSVAAVSSSNPIAVGDNDNRVSPRRAILFINDGPVEGWSSGLYKQILPSANPFPTSMIWWESVAMLKKVVEVDVTYSGPFPVTEVLKVYDVDGSTVIKTVTDSITYSGAFEVSRTRSIS